LPNVSNEDLKAFGIAVKRERSLCGWTLDELGGAFDPPIGKSFISKIEKGRKESLNSRTVGRFIKALDLNESWIDKFLNTDTTDEGEETKAEREADLIVDRALRNDVTGGASEELLIQLANTYAEGEHKDRDTAYIGVRNALAAFAAMKAKGAVQGNADDQFHLVMAEVTKLNDAGEVDDADALLDKEERRMREAHKDEQDRLDQQVETLLQQRIDQDDCATAPTWPPNA
jgi:transcriptional regulator with XRE-family HTH domain